MKDADVEVAQARLELALARIERSAAVRVRGLATTGAAPDPDSGSDNAPAELAAEVVHLRAENARLVRTLKALEERHAALKERSARAVMRLDSTIARVDDLFAR